MLLKSVGVASKLLSKEKIFREDIALEYNSIKENYLNRRLEKNILV